MDSKSLFERAQKVIPGGVNSPVRAFNAVGGTPIYVAKGAGARMWTVEGRELIDFSVRQQLNGIYGRGLGCSPSLLEPTVPTGTGLGRQDR